MQCRVDFERKIGKHIKKKKRKREKAVKNNFYVVNYQIFLLKIITKTLNLKLKYCKLCKLFKKNQL